MAETLTVTLTETTTVYVVETELTSSERLNVTWMRLNLPVLYDVRVEAIKIFEHGARRRLPSSAERRQLESIQYLISVAADPANVTQLVTSMSGTADHISSMLGADVTQSGASVKTHVHNTTRNVTTQREVSCPRGFWCSAGSQFAWCAAAGSEPPTPTPHHSASEQRRRSS